MARHHLELEIYRRATDAAMRIFALSRVFPREETVSLCEPLRRSSRTVAACIARAWRQGLSEVDPQSFVDAESAAAETQSWLEFAVRCDYLDKAEGRALFVIYEEIGRELRKLATEATDKVADEHE
jgi:four helix bundle protein